MTPSEPVADQAEILLGLYDRTLAEVYGYLVRRCGDAPTAEDLTAETFLAAVDAVRRGTVERLTPAWLVGVARNKLVDHWRRLAREERSLELVAAEPAPTADEWSEVLDAGPALESLATLGPHHRVALTLRYVDGLPVPRVAVHLGRTVHATEALLVRGRIALRRAYEERSGDGA